MNREAFESELRTECAHGNGVILEKLTKKLRGALLATQTGKRTVKTNSAFIELMNEAWEMVNINVVDNDEVKTDYYNQQDECSQQAGCSEQNSLHDKKSFSVCDTFTESRNGLLCSGRSEKCGGFSQEDGISFKCFDETICVFVTDGHRGNLCALEALKIFENCCHDMINLHNEQRICEWFNRRFVVPLQNQISGACVLMSVINLQGGWFLNLGDCRLYVDGKQKTNDSNVSSLDKKNMEKLNARLKSQNAIEIQRDSNNLYSHDSTHLKRSNDNHVSTQCLAVTASLGDKNWNDVLIRVPQVVFVQNYRRIILVSDGVTENLHDGYRDFSDADSVFSALRGTNKPLYDNASAIVISKN